MPSLPAPDPATVQLSEEPGARTGARTGALSRESRVIALIVAGGLLMEQFDSTVLTTALPAMARSFGTDPVRLSSAMTSYLLGLVILIPASGRIADRFGSRTVFRLAIALFTLGSLLSALAQTLPFLVLARLIQGCGGALMVPVGRLVLLRSVRKDQLINAMFWTLVPATIGPMLGPPVGGLLTTFLSWRWIFIINLPIGLFGLLVAGRIPQMRETARTAFDLVGALLSGAALVGLVFGLDMVRDGAGGLSWALPALAATLLVFGLYVLHARRTTAPILDLSLMRITTFRLSVAGGTASRIVVGGMPFLLPSMLQIGFGLSAAQSGLITFTTTLGSLLVRFLSARVLRALGYRTTLILNSAATCVLALSCALFQPGWPFMLLSTILFLVGFSQSLQFMSVNTIAYADVASERLGAATGLYSTLQQLGMTLGISVAAASVSASEAWRHHLTATRIDYVSAFVVVGLISTLAVPLFCRLPRNAGAELSGHRARAGR